jgi:hypothetical protein
MEKSTQQVASHLPLQQFVAGAVGELEGLHYSRRTLDRYRAVWRHFVEFCHDMSQVDQYSEAVLRRESDA